MNSELQANVYGFMLVYATIFLLQELTYSEVQFKNS